MVSRTEQILRREKMETTLPTLIELFVATKQIEGRSQKTTTWYRKMLTAFSRFLGDGARIRDITLSNARSFVASLQAKNTKYDGHPITPVQRGKLSPYTIHGYVRTLKVFGSWLGEEGFLSVNPFARLKRPKLPRPVIEILSEQEIQRLVEAINPYCFLGARMFTIVLLLLDTGIRAGELVTLTLDNTHVNGGRIKVVGKGNKERYVPFGATTKKALLRYVVTWRPEPQHDGIDELILSVDGTPLTYSGLAQMLKRLGGKAGVPRLHAHLFRHSFAVRYLMNGGDVMTLRLILGHSTLDVTEMYMHLAETHIQIQHHKFSPVDRLAIKSRRRRRKLSSPKA